MANTTTGRETLGQTAESVAHMILDRVNATPNAEAFRGPLPDDSGWRSLTWKQTYDDAEKLAAGLLSLGLEPEQRVAIASNTRLDWVLADMAIMIAGGATTTVYPSTGDADVAYILGDSNTRFLFAEDDSQVEKVRAHKDELNVEKVVIFDGSGDGDWVISMDDLRALGETFLGANPEGVKERAQSVKGDNLATLIYTSGTTGKPKGVELTHSNLLAELESTSTILETGPDDRIVSYLPDAHIANRWGAHYSSMYTGMQITTLDDLKQAIAVLPTVRPTLFGAVPQVWYKVKAAIDKTLAEEPSPIKKKLALWAIDVGRRRARLMSDGKPVPRTLEIQHALADKLVLSAVRKKLGLDQVRAAVTGAAAISPEVLEFVLALGIPCSEVWGMSETSCVVTINRPDAIRIGTVGQVVPGVEIKIAEDGELLVRGPLLMKGYRNDPEKTADTIDAAGWLHTGDIAEIDDDGYVRLIDRKKELIVNASGKNMSPANIEGALRAACPMLGGAAAIGNDRPYNVALLALDPDALAAFAAEHGLTGTHEELTKDPAVVEAVDKAVQAANAKLSRVEQIKKYALLPNIWEPSGDELTPTMKLKRKPIDAKYTEEIDKLYAQA